MYFWAVILFVSVVLLATWAGVYYWAKSTGRLATIERQVGSYEVWPAWMGKGAKKATYIPDVTNGTASFDPQAA